MAASSFRKLQAEISRLKALYVTCKHGFHHTREKIAKGIKSGEVNRTKPVLMDPSNPESEMVSPTAYLLLNRTRSQFPRYLRETLFVRLISALEVFLVDVVREIFLSRKDLFHSQSKLDFTYGEILSVKTVSDLWTKLINRELRKLQNQGFKEFARFYKSRFGIDFNNFSISLKSVQELHDRRHILVHRLGRTDDQYRHAYNLTLKRISVSEEYLAEAFDKTQTFGHLLVAAAQDVIERKPKDSEALAYKWTIELTLETITETSKATINPNFQFNVNDRILSLGDILALSLPEENRRIVTLSGPRSDVKAYLKLLQKLHRRNELIIHQRRVIHSTRKQKQPRCNLPREVVELIAKSLPKHPWPKGVHKEMAKHFGISNTQASAAISLILNEQDLLAMIGRGDSPPNN